MKTIQFLTNLFENLATRHKKIQMFGIGELDELNHSGIVYPLLYLYLDSIQINNPQLLNSPEENLVNFKIGVYSNIIEDDFGNKLVLNQSNTINPFNNTSALIVDTCNSYLNQILFKLIEEGNLVDSEYEVVSNSSNTISRIMNDDICGAETTLYLRMTNFDYCDYQNAFDEI